jgi:hypothetical protein
MHVVQLYTCMEPHDKGKNSKLIWGYVKDFIIEYNAYLKNNPNIMMPLAIAFIFIIIYIYDLYIVKK